MRKTKTKELARKGIIAFWSFAAGLVPAQVIAANLYATADLSETRPYAQQNTVYTVRVYTDRTLKTADVTLPQVSGGIFAKLDDEWDARPVKGQQGTYVNERRYLFTPLRAGRIEIPPATVSVTTGGGKQASSAQPWAQQYSQPWGQQPPIGQPYGQQQSTPSYNQPWTQQPGQQLPMNQPWGQPYAQPWAPQPGQQLPFGEPWGQPGAGQVPGEQAAAQQPATLPYSQYQQPYAYPGYPGFGQQQPAVSQGGGPSEHLELKTSALSVEVTALVGDAAGLLPLHNLRIEGNVQAIGEPRVGEPVTVGITVTGVGITGDRLPGITERLQAGNRNDDFKIYAERPHTDWAYDERLQAVVGRRIETVTLVPTRAGALELPIVEIPYWNVISNQQETASMATRPLRVQSGGVGAASSAQRPESRVGDEVGVPLRTESEDVWGFWLPVGGALLAAFFIGWRMGMAQRRQRRAREASEAGEAAPAPSASPSPSPFAALAPAAARTREAAAGLMPKALTARASAGTSVVLRGINRIIPRRLKVWTCMRCVERADEPQGICKVLRRFATDCLGLPENSSLQSIGRAVARQRPSAETSAYLNLFGRLDDATYGSTLAGFDVEAWKKDFRKLFGRLWRAPRSWARTSGGRGGLPELNPR